MQIQNLKQLSYYRTRNFEPVIVVNTLTGKGSFDVTNKSGIHTKTLKKLGVEDYKDWQRYYVEVPNPYYGLENTGKKCRECNCEGFKVKNGDLTRHLRDEHEFTIQDYLKKYPEESENFPTTNTRIQRIEFLDQELDNRIVCPLCQEKMKKIVRTHIEFKHNMTVEDFKKLTGLTNLSSESTLEKKRKNYQRFNEDINKGFNKVSKPEKEIRDFIFKLLPEAEIGKRKYLKGMEIDIYLPDLKLGIEYNGLYYHAEKSMGRNHLYHINKTEVAEENSITLLQIFSDEWEKKKDIVKGKIKQKILRQGEKVFARKCTIKEITSFECNKFLNKFHIQGTCPSSYKLGAFYNGELISVSTFSKQRLGMGKKGKVENTLELVRFCTKEGMKVIGILPKFLKHIKVLNPEVESVFSYADRRWTNSKDNIYLSTGFVLESISRPSYWYTKNYYDRIHRFTFAKYKLKHFEWFNENLTEWENMQSQKFDRVWDCGTLKYRWVY